jgi:hypothetical protein
VKVDPIELAESDTCPIGEPDPIDMATLNAICQRETCRHFLTVHSVGLAIHGKCRLTGCTCKGAMLTEAAIRRVKKGILP